MQKGQHSFLTPYRLEKLNSIGFSWTVRSALDTEVRNILEHATAVPLPLPPQEPTTEDEAVATATLEQVQRQMGEAIGTKDDHDVAGAAFV